MSAAELSTGEPLGHLSPTPTEQLWPDGRGVYCIRITDGPHSPCAICREPTGSGPVGHHRGAPICDDCLSVGDSDLGMIIGLIHEARKWAVSARNNPWGEDQHLSESFARCLCRLKDAAERWGPMRKGDDEMSW